MTLALGLEMTLVFGHSSTRKNKETVSVVNNKSQKLGNMSNKAPVGRPLKVAVTFGSRRYLRGRNNRGPVSSPASERREA